MACAHGKIERAAWTKWVESKAPGYSLNKALGEALDTGAAFGEGAINIVGALGLEDRVRPKAKSALSHAMGKPEDPRITVRMITGDCKHTAQAVALQVGLVSESDISESSAKANVVMDGKQFDDMCKVGDSYNNDKVKNVLENLRVLAKATPKHRRAVIDGLRS